MPFNRSAICNLPSAILLALLASGCGKKGPPLAPIIRIPAAVESLAAQRLGNEVYLTVTIPTENIDDSTPSAVRRVDVYAYTGLQPPGTRLMSAATLVASIPVANVPVDASGEPLPATPRAGEALQGAAVTVRDVLTPEAQTPRELPPPPGRRGPAPLPVPPSATPALPQRYYTAIGFSPRGSGPGGAIAAVPLGPIPDRPTGLTASYTLQGIRLAWEPAGGLIGFLLDRELGPDIAPVDEPFVARVESFGAPSAAPAVSAAAPTGQPSSVSSAPVTAPAAGSSAAITVAPGQLPPGPTRYHVYRQIAPDPLELPQGPARGEWQADLPVALNAVPLDVLAFEDPLLFDGRERCYHVRAVRGAGLTAAYSEPTSRICTTPVDVEAPVAPTGLTAEALDGAITLLWDPNVEEDLAGYLILRGVPGDATLTLLTEQPVSSARYVDRAVTPGTSYVYAVVAVDDRVPLGNVSGESNRVDAAAR